MASAGDGATPYQSGGAGGKFRKRPIRRSAQATPYDRPPTALRNNSPSLFAKLMDPASRLIYAGADRLFGVFRKRLPSIAAPRPPETREEPKPSTVEGENLTSISAATEISELENMLKQKTFTRSEIEHLTALLHSKSTNSDADEGNRQKPTSPSSHLLRLEPSTSTPLINHLDEKENFHAAISTPVVTSRPFEEDVASPAELARAYMGTVTPKVSSPSTLRFGTQAPRQDSVLLNTTTILPKTPITSLTPRTSTVAFKPLENGFTTPRSRGRSAIYNMARTPYYRPPSSFSQKGINSPSLSQPTWEQQGSITSSKMASKRRSSVLDDIGSGGPVRRIRQKASLLSQGSPLSRNRNEFSQKLLLQNESKSIEENGETSRSTLGYTSVPTKSTQMATKILERLERLSPKEKSPSSRLARLSDPSPSKLTSNTSPSEEKVDSPKLLLSSQDSQKPVNWLTGGRELTSQSKGKEKVEENGPKKFAVPRNVLTTMNGNSTLQVKDNGMIVANKDSTFKLPTEPPQKKRFQMSAHEDSLDVDDDSHSNRHVSINPLVQNKKSVFANKTDVIQTPASPEFKKDSLPQADKIPEMPKKIDDAVSLPKTDFGSLDGSVVSKKKVAFSFSASPPSSTNNQPAVIPQTTSTTETASPQKKAPVFPTFGATIKTVEEKATPFSFSANEPSGFKPNAIPDAKPLASSNVFNTVKENNQVQFSAPNKDDNGNAPKSVNIFSKTESLQSASPTTSSSTGIFSFGSKDSSITNGTPASTPSTFSSSSPFPAFNTTTNNLFSGSSSSTTSLTSLPSTSSVFSTSTPAPVFSFGSKIASSTKPPETKDTESKPATTTTTGSSIFGFSSPAATSTANDHQSQGSLINGTTGFQASFGGTTTIPSSTSGTSPFGSSAPSFGLGSSNVSGPSFGLGSAVATSSETKSSNMFSSTWQAPNSSSTFGSTPTAFSFGASSTSTSPSVFGSSTTASSSSMFSFTSTNSAFPAPSSGQSVFGNSTPVFGSSPNNIDQMSMEDTMAEDNTPTPSPSVSVFGQPPSTPGFMFGSGSGSATQTPPPSTVPFQFGGQTTNQQPLQNPFQTTNQNPFQASGSADFSAGGSFSLGSGGGDKSGRRILKVKRGNRRK